MKFGLLGRTLGHSFSPRIHNALGNTNYELFEREPSQLQEFFANPELQGINITFPYKVNALEACDVVDPRAERIGCVNTMVYPVKNASSLAMAHLLLPFTWLLKI